MNANADVDNAQVLNDYGKFAGIILADASLFDRTFLLLKFAKKVNRTEVEDAKSISVAASEKIKKVEADIKNMGDATDGISIGGCVFGIISAALMLIPGGQPAAIAIAATGTGVVSGVATVASIGTTAVESGMSGDLDRKLKNIQKDETMQLAHNSAYQVLESIGVLDELDQAFQKMSPRISTNLCFMALAITYDDANSDKETFKDILEDFHNISRDKDLTDVLKLLSKDYLKDLLREDPNILDNPVELAKGVRFVLKSPLTVSKILSASKYVALMIKGVRSRRAVTIVTPIMPDIAGNVNLPVRPVGQVRKFTKLFGTLSISLDVVGIVLNIIDICQRNENQAKVVKELKDTLENFSNAMDEVLIFQETFFPRNKGDALRALIDRYRLNTLKDRRQILNDTDSSMVMGLVLDNRSKYTFDVSKMTPETWRGGYFYTPMGSLVGSKEMIDSYTEEGSGDFDNFAIFSKGYQTSKHIGGVSYGRGFSGMFMLRARGEKKIQIPIWFFYAYNKPWEVMGAYADIDGFYDSDGDKIWYHIKDEAYDGNKVHTWAWNDGVIDGGSSVIKNSAVSIKFSTPAKIIEVTIDDRHDDNEWAAKPQGTVTVHLEGIGDKDFKFDTWAGTSLEGFEIKNITCGLKLEYMAHIASIGDTPWTSGFVGTRGQGRSLQGFAIRIKGPNPFGFAVQYKANIQYLGDHAGWYGNGEYCGTKGKGLKVEAMSIRIVQS